MVLHYVKLAAMQFLLLYFSLNDIDTMFPHRLGSWFEGSFELDMQVAANPSLMLCTISHSL